MDVELSETRAQLSRVRQLASTCAQMAYAMRVPSALLDKLDQLVAAVNGDAQPTAPTTKTCAGKARPKSSRHSSPPPTAGGPKKTKRCSWPGCEAAFRDRVDLDNHMWRHTGRKAYACDWIGCGKTFASKCIMRKHAAAHVEPRRFRCEFARCDAAFVSADELETHFGDAHDGQKPYRCELCAKPLSSKLNLQKHLYAHREPKKFVCQFGSCGQSYVKRNQLLAHECRAHTGVKPFRCDWPGCDYEACYEQTLKNHQLRHTDLKPYKCSWPKCEWSFRRNDHLKVHQLKHTGEKPFSCDWPGCERRFQTRQTLRSHVNNTHGERA